MHRFKNAIVTLLFLFGMLITLPAEARWCGQPLGVARGGNSELPDSMIKASSEDYRYPASSGRLKDSGWAPVSSDEDPYPYLQIDLDNLYLVCGVKVQGCEDFDRKQAWVTRYRVQVSPEKDFWESWNYIKPEFYGGKSAKEIFYSEAKERKVGQYVRIFPVSFNNWPCMKVEVYGKSYIRGKVPVFVADFQNMIYTMGQTDKVDRSSVSVENHEGFKKEYNFQPGYTKVIPELKPLKTELKVDTCVLAPYRNNQKISGRIHEVKDNSYVIEYLLDVIRNEKDEMARVRNHKWNELVVIYSAWCKKIEYSAKCSECGSNLCLGTIVRVDSELVFQAKGNSRITNISYKENRPPVSDYVSNQPVVPSEVTEGDTVLFYSDLNGCLRKGKVTLMNEEAGWYQIDGKGKQSSEVRYSEGHDVAYVFSVGGI